MHSFPSFLNKYNRLKTIQPSGIENDLNLKSLENILSTTLYLNVSILFMATLRWENETGLRFPLITSVAGTLFPKHRQ